MARTTARKYRIQIQGIQPLLMHADDISWADQMDAWKVDKDNKAGSKAGDDRSPAWRWIGNLYQDGKQITVPTDNIMKSLMGGGAMVLVPGGKMGKTFKSQTQSGIMPTSIGWPLLIDGKPIDYAPLKKLIGNKDFEAHKKASQAAGFDLYLKRAKIGSSKHVRVRPRFETWSAVGELMVTDDQITTAVLSDIFETAGIYKGIGDWRPGGKTPGSFGMFTAVVKEI
jgi:hypothetical protein